MIHGSSTISLVQVKLVDSRARWQFADVDVELDLSVPIHHFLVDYECIESRSFVARVTSIRDF